MFADVKGERRALCPLGCEVATRLTDYNARGATWCRLATIECRIDGPTLSGGDPSGSGKAFFGFRGMIVAGGKTTT
ncbi:hypothetical protein NAP1_07155 [Erythrobacter sp. NAP1]|nr:hypothetical protein NAP1_07155 [Erythrobacter sp. NAP1]